VELLTESARAEGLWFPLLAETSLEGPELEEGTALLPKFEPLPLLSVVPWSAGVEGEPDDESPLLLEDEEFPLVLSFGPLSFPPLEVPLSFD
jgi:hypothetical protein